VRPPLAPCDWLGALEAEFAALATGTLGLSNVKVEARLDAPPPAMAGAYLGLLAPWGGVQLALVSDADGCAAIARGLLGTLAGEALEPPDVADAVCEVVNILAGAVKARVRQHGPLQMGLPTFFRGPVQPTERLGVWALSVRAGDVPAALVVVHPRS
jgi:hypothetical protein